MMFPTIVDIDYYLPEKILTNEDIAREFPEWTVEKIAEKTGINSRHIASDSQTASDLAYEAAEKLLQRHPELRDQVDLLVFCTQTPDYALPTTACVLQDRLSLQTACLAFDYNLGCSGFVVGLSVVKSMLQSGEATTALLLTGETYSKWMDPNDKSVRTIFGDAGTATLVTNSAPKNVIGPFVYGTDGRGKNRLIVHGSGARKPEDDDGLDLMSESHPQCSLFMDGAEIFSFTIRAVPKTVRNLLKKSELSWDNIAWCVFHQANTFMLEHLRKQCRIPEEKFVLCLQDFGNTVSNTIPIVLREMLSDGRLKSGQRLMLVGFGVGYSWSACILEWY
jgi:3-oxoacyl-[acyl-carrier-protein] synthase III